MFCKSVFSGQTLLSVWFKHKQDISQANEVNNYLLKAVLCKTYILSTAAWTNEQLPPPPPTPPHKWSKFNWYVPKLGHSECKQAMYFKTMVISTFKSRSQEICHPLNWSQSEPSPLTISQYLASLLTPLQHAWLVVGGCVCSLDFPVLSSTSQLVLCWRVSNLYSFSRLPSVAG